MTADPRSGLVAALRAARDGPAAEAEAWASDVGGAPAWARAAAWCLSRWAEARAEAAGYAHSTASVVAYALETAAAERGKPETRPPADGRAVLFAYPDGSWLAFERAPYVETGLGGWARAERWRQLAAEPDPKGRGDVFRPGDEAWAALAFALPEGETERAWALLGESEVASASAEFDRIFQGQAESPAGRPAEGTGQSHGPRPEGGTGDDAPGISPPLAPSEPILAPLAIGIVDEERLSRLAGPGPCETSAERALALLGDESESGDWEEDRPGCLSAAGHALTYSWVEAPSAPVAERVAVPGDDELWSLGLPGRVVSALRGGGIDRVPQLVSMTRAELGAVRRLGRTGLAEVVSALSERGLALREDA